MKHIDWLFMSDDPSVTIDPHAAKSTDIIK